MSLLRRRDAVEICFQRGQIKERLLLLWYHRR